MDKKKRAASHLLIVAAYVISGKAALMLALPPGYASAVFPPAGIAVAAAFILGTRALAPVFLGSLLLNAWVGYEAHGQISLTAAGAAALIALASVAQAGIGGRVLRLAVGYPAALDNGRDISRFLLLAPLVCLTSASLSMTALWAMGLFEPGAFGANWLTWWVGDTLGVLVLFPIAMTFAGEPRALWRTRRSTVALPLAVLFMVVVTLFLKATEWEQDNSLTEYYQISEQSLALIQARFEEQTTLLSAIQSRIEYSRGGTLPRKEFREFADGMLKRFSMVQAIEWAPRVGAAQRKGFEAAQRREIPGFEIRERAGADKHMVGAQARSEYFPVTYVEPVSGNQQAIGFDLASNALRLAAIEKTRDSGLPVATAPITLVQADNQHGLLYMKSVSIGGKQTGIVLTVLKMRDFIGKSLPAASRALQLRFIDAEKNEILYDSFAATSHSALFDRSFELGMRRYRLQTLPTAEYIMQHRGWESWGVLAMGMLGAGIAGALMLLGTGYNARVLRLVDERTRELREASKEIHNYVEMVDKYVITSSTDLHGIITSASDAFCRISGYAREELIGASHNIVRHPDMPKTLYKEMWDTLQAGGVWRGEIKNRARDGGHYWVDVSIEPKRAANGTMIGYTAIRQDITAKKLAEELSVTDSLTRLNNRMKLDNDLKVESARAIRFGHALSLILFDVDHFKNINDTYGHREGDQVLIRIAALLRANVREVDIAGRWGGEEFLVICPETSESGARVLAEKLRLAIAGHEFPGIGRQSCSFGVAEKKPGETVDAAIHRADEALYRAKHSGRNRVVAAMDN